MWQITIVVGNVGRPPELRYTPSGRAVVRFSVATNRVFLNSSTGEREKETCWFQVSAWGKVAESVHQYVKKGMRVLCEGRLTPDKNTGNPRIWTSEKDGEAHSAFELNAYKVLFLGGGREDGADVDVDDLRPIEEDVVQVGPDDDIPF